MQPHEHSHVEGAERRSETRIEEKRKDKEKEHLTIELIDNFHIPRFQYYLVDGKEGKKWQVKSQEGAQYQLVLD